MEVSVRSFQPEDAEGLGQVFHRAVREGACHRYAPAQLSAWSPAPPKGEGWANRLAAANTVVAEKQARPVGFMTMDSTGFVDLAFVLPEEMGQGVADVIYAVLEGRARAHGIRGLSTQASLLAEPFFARHGWRMSRRQTVEIGGVVLENAWMEKPLTCEVAP